MANRRLAVLPRTYATDTHGDRVPSGFGPQTPAYPGLAQIQGDSPLGQPGGRTWVLDLDPTLDPVNQQDMVIDPDSGEQWNATSAQLIRNTLMPLLDHIRVEARLYQGGSRS